MAKRSLSATVAILFLIVLIVMWVCNNNSGNNNQGFFSNTQQKQPSPDSIFAPADLEGTNAQLGSGCIQNSGQFIASSLLPQQRQTQEEFSLLAPTDKNLTDKSFLTPRQSFGIDTVGSSLRNANQQLRSEPPNPRTVLPFMNSSIATDTGHAHMEIGGGA